MAGDVYCPSCRRKLRVPSTAESKEFQCPLCSTIFSDLDSLATVAQPSVREVIAPVSPFADTIDTNGNGCVEATGATPQKSPVAYPGRPGLSPPVHVAAAFLLGGLPAGFLVTALNFAAMREKTVAFWYWVVAVLALASVLVLPARDKTPLIFLTAHFLLSVMFSLVLPGSLFFATYKAHRKAGGKRRSFWVVVGLSLLTCGFVVGTTLANQLARKS